ncbi:MAG: aminodeoxychorismate/anthranilate synthase component II [Caulobacterales bacterium]
MILVIDNYDSFVYNLVHYVEDLGSETEVHRNDAITVEGVLKKKPKGVLISPGPGNPKQAGIILDFLRRAPADLPIFGVCLGHQAIGEAFGGDVISAKHIMHGKTSEVRHKGGGLMRGLPSPFTATRYHSLAIKPETLPDVLTVDAETEDGEIMAVHHKSRPIFGVQFHPESIASQHGHAMIGTFLDAAGAR